METFDEMEPPGQWNVEEGRNHMRRDPIWVDPSLWIIVIREIRRVLPLHDQAIADPSTQNIHYP